MTTTLLKGFCLTILAWLGITITTPNGFLYIHIAEFSVGWFLVYLFSFLMLINGVHKIYTYLRRMIKCFRLKNYRKIIARNGGRYRS